MNIRILSSASFFILIFFQSTVAQKEIERNDHSAPVDQTEVRSLVISSNKIKTILYNTGSLSAPNVTANVLDFVWNGLGYAYEIGFLAGAKVPSSIQPLDSIAIIVDGYLNPSDGDYSPGSNTKWGWLPTAHFQNPSSTSIANNQDPSSWPLSWSSWNGAFGNAIADMEVVYEMNDSTDAEFPYYPIPSDSTRRGLGLSTTARYYQFSHQNLEDVLFTFFTLQNVSNKPLSKMVAGIFTDPHIGGPIDFGDDVQDYDTTHHLLYSWDFDSISSVPPIKAGYFGITLLSTPEDKGVTSYSAFPFGGSSRPKNDNFIYNTLSEGSMLNDMFYSKYPNAIGDFILTMGTGFFSLAPGQKEEFGVAYLFGKDLAGLIERSAIVELEYPVRFGKIGNPIALTSPAADQKITSAQATIQWNDTMMDNDTTVDLYYSNVPDGQWIKIANNIPNNGSFSWDISAQTDGIFYQIHMVKNKNGAISKSSTSGYFTVNRPGEAPPQIALLQPKNNPLLKNFIPIQWLGGDADDDPVTIKIHYSGDNGTTYSLLSEMSNTGSYQFDSRTVANSTAAKIKLEAVANGSSAFSESNPFRIANFFYALTDTNSLKHTTGRATGKIFPGVADSSKVTGNSYRISFDSVNGTLRYSLFNLTKNQTALTSEPLTSLNGSGTLIDGLRIWFLNDPWTYDTVRSGFTSVVPNVKPFFGKPSIGTWRMVPIEYTVVFNSLDTNAAGNYLFPADSVGNPASPFTKKIAVPFKIHNATDTATLQFLAVDQIKPGNKTGRWDFGELVVVLTPYQYRISPSNTSAALTFHKIDANLPVAISGGETYRAYLKFPFDKNDVYEFTADVQYGKPTSAPGGTATPKEFVLEQNFPNPFNPETTFRFSLAQRGRTSLRIYDAIGREVRTLFEEEMKEGNYSAVWDGNDKFGSEAASGIYFYRLQSGSFSSTKKMVLLR